MSAGYVAEDGVMPGSPSDTVTPSPTEVHEAKKALAQALQILSETSVPEDAVLALWMGSLTYAYGFDKGERANEIAGRYVRRFDERGLHPASVAWGAIQACESLVPELAIEGVATTPKALRDAAREDAWSEHLDAIGAA